MTQESGRAPGQDRARCAVCHDALGGERHECRGCGTLLHPDCRSGLQGCPTLGCVDQRAPAPRDAPGKATRPRRRWGRWILAGVVLVLLFNPVTLLLVSMRLSFRRIEQNEAALREARVYEPVARRLALYCQSDPALLPKWIDGGWIPPEVARLAPHAWGSVDPQRGHAGIELGGGFYHYGYRLQRDPAASTAEANVWHLLVYRDYEPGEPLFTLQLSPRERLSAEQLAELVITAHDDQIARRPEDPDGYKRKIQSYLQLGKVHEARRAVAEMVTRLPDDWWANVVHALVLAETVGASAGERSLRSWVDREPSFFSWLDLAYYFQLRGEHEKAAEAVLEATRFDANTAWGHGGNSEHRGYTAAKYVYDTGHPAAALRLCEHLRPVTINGRYAKDSLGRLSAAAERAVAGEVTSVGWGGMSPFDPFESSNMADASVDIDALLGREVDRPTYERARRHP